MEYLCLSCYQYFDRLSAFFNLILNIIYEIKRADITMCKSLIYITGQHKRIAKKC